MEYNNQSFTSLYRKLNCHLQLYQLTKGRYSIANMSKRKSTIPSIIDFRYSCMFKKTITNNSSNNSLTGLEYLRKHEYGNDDKISNY